MGQLIWEQLKNAKLGPAVQLRDLLFSDPAHAVFRAEYELPLENPRDVLVRLFLEDGKYPEERVNRFLEAKYFDHPHLLRYLEAGTLPTSEGTVTYAVSEQADPWDRSLAAEQVIEFTQHIISGLQYLHARNLVYCVLSPDTVVPVGADWKLSDFSELRVAGTDTREEVLSLASNLDTCPPEAAEGLISPAWDLWSLAQTLRQVLEPHKVEMPDPIKAVFLACLNLRPSSRPTLDQLSGLLTSNRPAPREPGLSTAARA